MAKLGEGDERWIVTDLGEAGRNVNNWHWTERDCTEWSKERLGQLFSNMQLLSEPHMSVAATGLDSVTGEAFLNVRKNKLIPSYELDVRVKWAGELKDGDGSVVAKCTGKVSFPYISDENHDEDTEVRVICDTNEAAAERIKSAILTGPAKQALVGAVHTFVAELRAGGPALAEQRQQQQQQESGTNGITSGSSDTAAAAKAAADKVAADKAAKAEATAAAQRGSTRTISLTERFHCRAADIFDCFVNEGRICAFTQSKASVSPRPGGPFSWYGGSIQGEFVELGAPHKLVLKWRFSTWEDGCYSKVVLSIDEPEHGNTVVSLKQTDVPIADKYGNENVVDMTESGWRGQIFSRIRSVFGYGA